MFLSSFFVGAREFKKVVVFLSASEKAFGFLLVSVGVERDMPNDDGFGVVGEHDNAARGEAGVANAEGSAI